jgi:glutamate-1-semialdehyde 2,1-aminomutase
MLRGHSPNDQRAVALAALEAGEWFQTGQVGHLESELADTLAKATGFESILFTTTGAQATATACMLARATTSRRHVVKAIGGWHGVQPWSTSGVSNPSAQECLGMPESALAETIAVPFNDTQVLHDLMSRRGDEIAAIILEPVLGNAGMILGTREYLQSARRLASRFGSCFILDEIVTGFRVRPGPMWPLYGVKPDLIVLGKSICGGMPFAAICGERRWFDSAKKHLSPRVMADLGTFTAHPGTMACVLHEIRQLLRVSPATYTALCERMADLRRCIEKTLARYDIVCAATGRSFEPGIPDFPIGTIRFAATTALPFHLAGDATVHWNAAVVDIHCRTTTSRILLMLEGVYSWQGLGALSFAHSETDIQCLARAYETVAPRLAVALQSGRR